MRSIDEDDTIAPDVLVALDDARRVGGDDGSCRIDLPPRWEAGHAEVVIDEAAIARHRAAPQPSESKEERTVSGHLHSIDVEPDQVAIRAYDDTDWRCPYPAELEPDIVALIGQVVVAEGIGWVTGPRRGSMDIRRIRPAFPEPDQGPDDMASVPATAQGLGAIASDDWTGDEQDQRYLAALLERM